MSNYYLDKMEELKADGIDFMPICFDKELPPIISSYSKEEFEKVKIIPKTDYKFWKMVNGIKEYINYDLSNERLQEYKSQLTVFDFEVERISVQLGMNSFEN